MEKNIVTIVKGIGAFVFARIEGATSHSTFKYRTFDGYEYRTQKAACAYLYANAHIEALEENAHRDFVKAETERVQRENDARQRVWAEKLRAERLEAEKPANILAAAWRKYASSVKVAC
jgi:hypothetical protein